MALTPVVVQPVSVVHALVYGIVQGLTAFLPISSDAHIRLVPAIMHWEDPGAAFTAVIQLGPTLAVLIYFAKEIGRAVKAWAASLGGKDKDTPDAKLGWGVFWGTIPIIVLGVALQHRIETSFRSLYYIAFSFIAVAIVMFLADRQARERRKVDDVQVKDGIVVGLWQCLALIPGMSRSGSTIAGSLFQGFDRESAARFSFMMGVPSFTAAGVYEAIKYHKELTGAVLAPLAVSLVVSFVVGYACIAWFLHYLQRRGIAPFVIYRIVLGIAIIALVQAKVLDPNAGAKPLDTKPAAAAANSNP